MSAGGKREGCGRKKVEDKQDKQVTFRLSDKDYDILSDIAALKGMTPSAFAKAEIQKKIKNGLKKC